jgi:outer membrane lipoprotein-sorting protein
MRFSITLLPLAVAMLSVASPAHADPAVLDAWLARQAGIHSLDVAFTQERRLPALKQPVSTPGRLSLVKPGKLRWQLGDPVRTLAVSDGRTLTLSEDGGKSVRRMAADSPQATRYSMFSGDSFGSSEAFHRTFEVVEAREAHGLHGFTLRPRDRRMRSEVPWVFIDVDPKTSELRAFELELRDRSRVRTMFQQPRVNIELPDALFTAPD